MNTLPSILKDFNPDWYFTRSELNERQKLQVEIALVYYSSADDAISSIISASNQALKELLKIEKRKTVLAKVKSVLKKRYAVEAQ
jgi:hypothetical protein